MKPVTEPILRAAANAFDFGGPVVCDARHYGEGHINDTFVVWREDHSKRFILQRINTDTFTDPVGLMENVCGVTRHLRETLKKPLPPMRWAVPRTLHRRSPSSTRGKRTATPCWICWQPVRSRCVSPTTTPRSTTS